MCSGVFSENTGLLRPGHPYRDHPIQHFHFFSYNCAFFTIYQCRRKRIFPLPRLRACSRLPLCCTGKRTGVAGGVRWQPVAEGHWPSTSPGAAQQGKSRPGEDRHRAVEQTSSGSSASPEAERMRKNLPVWAFPCIPQRT